MKILGLLSIVSLWCLSCVTPMQFKQLQEENQTCLMERELLKKENEKLTVDNKELTAKLEVLEEEIASLKSNKDGLSIKELQAKYESLEASYNDLKNTHSMLLQGSDAETRKLLGQLQNTQQNLQVKEDELNQLAQRLDNDRKNLEQLKAELDQRNRRLNELERILEKKDKAVKDLKRKVTNALLGYENQGLSITQKNGKVYVSLEEKLLFESGSTEVGHQGVAALKKLARVLEQNPDINITIEGHTDDVPVIPGSKFQDNWDLSVLRANAIVRILLSNSNINPVRLTASGRSQYLPLDSSKTPEARQKNRRTEIILTPNLDELFRILDSE